MADIVVVVEENDSPVIVVSEQGPQGAQGPAGEGVDYVGLTDRAESTISLSTRTFTIAPVGSSFELWLGSSLIDKTSSNVTITDSIGQHFIYFDSADETLKSSTSVWDVAGANAPVATVYWDGAAGWIGDERHGPRDTVQRRFHEMMHETVGARYAMGLTGTFDATSMSITSGEFYDEDIEHTVGAKTACRLIYRNVSNQMVDTPNCATPYLVAAGALQYDSAGTPTAVTLNQYVVNDVYVTNDQDYPIYVVVGQAQYANINLARSAAQATITNIATREWKLIYRVIYRNTAGSPAYVEATDYRTSSSLPGGAVTSLPASSVVVTPSGNIAATNAQAALEELDTEKLAATGGTLTNYKESLYSTTTAGNVTIDLANGNVQRFILDAARQFTMPADPGAYGQSFVLIIECATFTPTWNATPTIEWLTSDGTAPTLVTTANLVNVLTFIWDDVDSRWLGFLAGKETA